MHYETELSQVLLQMTTNSEFCKIVSNLNIKVYLGFALGPKKETSLSQILMEMNTKIKLCKIISNSSIKLWLVSLGVEPRTSRV